MHPMSQEFTMATTTTTKRKATATKQRAKATKNQAKATGRQAARTAKSAERDVERSLRETVSRTGYAAVGVGDAAVEAVRNLRHTAAKLPSAVLTLPETATSIVGSTTETVKDVYIDLVERGRNRTGQIGDEPTVKKAKAKGTQAKNQAKSATGQTKAAATKTARKASSQAKKATDSVTTAAKTTAGTATTQAKKASKDVKDAAKSTARTAERQGKQAGGQTSAAASKGAETAKATGDAARTSAKKLGSPSTTSRSTSTSTSSSSSSTGEGPLEDRTVEELYARATELDIDGRSTMTKDELVKAIRDENS
jgi:hypothetical protein